MGQHRGKDGAGALYHKREDHAQKKGVQCLLKIHVKHSKHESTHQQGFFRS